MKYQMNKSRVIKHNLPPSPFGNWNLVQSARLTFPNLRHYHPWRRQ